METNKLQKLEQEAHQWVQQALPNLEKFDIIYPQMKQLINAAEEQNQLLGPNMENIAEMPMSEKMSILSSLTTLTIDIQKALQIWTDFQHHLSITAPAIIEVCVQRRPTIRLHSPQHEQASLHPQEFVFEPPCFFGTKKRLVRGGDVEGASRQSRLE